MVFRKATASDIYSVEQSYIEFLKHEQVNGAWTVWKLGVYPTIETARKSFEQDTLYVLEDNGLIVASVTLDKVQPKEYKDVSWGYMAEDHAVLVIHTLCVRPSKAGKGLGKKMVHYSIEEAKLLGCKVLRLDTGGQNKPAIGLYTKMGFNLVSLGTILLDGKIAHEGHVFMEYVITHKQDTSAENIRFVYVESRETDDARGEDQRTGGLIVP